LQVGIWSEFGRNLVGISRKLRLVSWNLKFQGKSDLQVGISLEFQANSNVQVGIYLEFQVNSNVQVEICLEF